MNGLLLLLLIVALIGIAVAYRAGLKRGRGDPLRSALSPPVAPFAVAESDADLPLAMDAPVSIPPEVPDEDDSRVDVGAEKARIIVSLEHEATVVRRDARRLAADAVHGAAVDDERRSLYRDLASAHAETARYRQLLVDLENNAPPPLLDQPGAPDDLKLIVGVGPVLERMLQQLGISTYRQIARWTERDIDAFDARLLEFPGRIRRDEWVTQARALHQSKYGETLPHRERS